MAQLVEHIVHIDGVTGSSPVATTNAEEACEIRLLSFCLFFGRGFTFSFQAVSFFDVDRLVDQPVHLYSM